MTEKELRRLSRSELLELLLVQTKETERLAEQLQKAETMLSDRYLRVETAGDLAHAVLEINGVMQAAQAAAQQYLDNIARMEQQAALRCEEMIHEARMKAERIIQDATAAAKQPLGGIHAEPDEETGDGLYGSDAASHF